MKNQINGFFIAETAYFTNITADFQEVLFFF